MHEFSPGVTGCEREKSVTLPECCATPGQTRGDYSWFARPGILSELRSKSGIGEGETLGERGGEGNRFGPDLRSSKGET